MPSVTFTKSPKGQVSNEEYRVRDSANNRRELKFQDQAAVMAIPSGPCILEIDFSGQPKSSVSFVINDGATPQRRRVTIPKSQYSISTFRKFSVT